MPNLEGKHAQTRAECVPTLPYLCRQCTASTLSIVVQYAIAIENICPIFTKLFSLIISSFFCRSYHVSNEQSPDARLRVVTRQSSKDAPIFFTSFAPVASLARS